MTLPINQRQFQFMTVVEVVEVFIGSDEEDQASLVGSECSREVGVPEEAAWHGAGDLGG